jgi:hypothetical protein
LPLLAQALGYTLPSPAVDIADALPLPETTQASLLRLRPDTVTEGASADLAVVVAATPAAAASATAAARAALLGLAAHTDRGYYTVPAADADAD